ncbi:MAG: PilZ domain-containing protein [Desulfofustis sp.]|jgi:hypothetical protein
MRKKSERRAAFRMDVVSKAICRLIDGDQVISGPIKDISILGLYMEADGRPDIGSEFDIEIILSGRHSEMVLGSMSGKVARLDDHGLAITFDERFEWFAMVPLYFHTGSDSPV